ncbi:MAG: hypothetical protein II028_02515 [Clostridia bacterium]|nr:hypothetical protein [Clostridia bacterium]
MLGFLQLIGLMGAAGFSPYYWEKSRRSLAVRLIVAATATTCFYANFYALDGTITISSLLFYLPFIVLAYCFAEYRRRKAAKAEQAAPSDEPEA